jgi:LexA-binding, inner membrane-associated putative hydrolase
MPGYRTHLMGGVTTYVPLLYLLLPLKPTPLTMLEWLGCTLIGSLFPDVDTKSKGQLWFYRLLFLVLVVLVYKKNFLIAAVTSILCMLPLLFRHRGLFHRPLFLIGIPAAGLLVLSVCAPKQVPLFLFDALFFSVGALSHIVLDRGIRALFRV